MITDYLNHQNHNIWVKQNPRIIFRHSYEHLSKNRLSGFKIFCCFCLVNNYKVKEGLPENHEY